MFCTSLVFTSTRDATCRELQFSLVLQLSWKGAPTPLVLVPPWGTSTQAPTYRRLQPSLCFQGPRFINFQTGSTSNINQTSIFLHQPNSFSPIKTESNKHFSVSCTENTVTVIKHQFSTQNTTTIKQKQLEHKSIDVRYFNVQKLACICFCT